MPPTNPLRPRRDRPPTTSRPHVAPLRGRRALFVRVGTWTALAAGPVALLGHVRLLAVESAEEPVAVVRPTAVLPAEGSGGAGDGGAAGFAETVLGMWLESGTAAEASPEMARLRSLAPGVRAPRWGSRPVAVVQVAAVDSERRGSGEWLVMLAARLDDGVAGLPAGESVKGLRYFAVPVTETGVGAGRAFVAGAPQEAAWPQTGRAPSSAYTARVGDTTLVDTVDGFLSAFLGSEGGAERYLVPGTVLTRPEVGFVAVETHQVLAQGRPPGAGQDGAATSVRAEVTAVDVAGRSWPMAYALTLTARDGRWEIASLDAAPATRRS